MFREAGVERSVTAVNADVRQLPFADDELDAIVSIDAFEYFATGAQVGFVSVAAHRQAIAVCA